MIDLRQLEHFVATVRCGGVRLAAREIHLSPSAVTRSIRALEDHYGVELLVREGKRVYPTAYGRALAEDAQAVFAGVRGLESKLRQLAQLETGHLRVGLSPSMVHITARDFLPRIMVSHPMATLEIRQGHADELLDLMLNGAIDMAVAHERPFAVHDGVVAAFLHQEVTGWWVHEKHPLLSQQKIDLADLFRYPVVTQRIPSPYQAWIEDLRIRAASCVPPASFRHVVQISDYNVLLHLLSTSDAVGAMPNRCVETGGGGAFRRIHAELEPVPFNVAIAWLRTTPLSPLAQRFTALLREEMGK